MSDEYTIRFGLKGNLSIDDIRSNMLKLRKRGFSFFKGSIYAPNPLEITERKIRSITWEDLKYYIDITQKSSKSSICDSLRISQNKITLLFPDYILDRITDIQYKDLVRVLVNLFEVFEITDVEVVYGNNELRQPWIIFIPEEKSTKVNLKKITELNVYDIIDVKHGKLIIVEENANIYIKVGGVTEKILEIVKGFNTEAYVRYIHMGDKDKIEGRVGKREK
ncbi:MAG TPA: hypothetical protein VJC16_06050 [Candidatus Nanoarchaeia archaeon]|nr:hypothetical protein [Candidatus Nanoarchaeia archaeon]